MQKVHDLRLEIYDKRVSKLFDDDLKRIGVSWDASYYDFSGYYYYVIELTKSSLNTILKDLANVYILYFAMLDVFKNDFEARVVIQKQFRVDVSVLLDRLDGLCS